MRTLLAVAALVTLVPAPDAFAQASRPVVTDHGAGHGATPAAAAREGDLKSKILALEAQRVAAMVKKDIPALAALLADDMSYTHSGGTTDTKASFLTLIKDRGRYLGVDYSNAEVISWGGSTVLVRGIAQIRLEGTPGYPVIFADVWALREGTWKMVAWQATRPKP